MKYLAAPRVLACVLLLPLLTVLADVMGLVGSTLICLRVYGIDDYHYWRHTREFVKVWDVMVGLIKAVVFGGVLSLIACHRGFNSRPGAEGVGRAATEAFVVSFVAILMIDFVLAMLANTVYALLWPPGVRESSEQRPDHRPRSRHQGQGQVRPLPGGIEQQGGRIEAPAATPAYSPGLEGVIAGETAICTVEGGLSYRGYGVGDLAEKCSFDEVAYLLLYGELPTAAELKAFQTRVAAARRLPPPLKELLAALPKWTTPLDALRTAVSALGHFDQDAADNSHDANLRKAERLLAQIPVVIADHYHLVKGQPEVQARQDLSHAANFLYMLRGGEAAPAEVKAMDVSLILYAEHEFNASTFAARVIVSTLSDLHSGITGAIGALKGPLHGGANEKVMDILLATGGPDKAEEWTRAAAPGAQGAHHGASATGSTRPGTCGRAS